jgi:hypothetical protein
VSFPASPRLLAGLLAGLLAAPLAVLGGCAPAPPPPSQPPVVAIATASPAPAPAGSLAGPSWQVFRPGGGPVQRGSGLLWRVEVAWRVASRAPNCIYFVGPGSLGQLTSLGEEARLQQENGKVSLSFGSDAVYEGQPQDTALTLRRTHEYTYQGDLWTTTEEMVGTYAAGSFEGSYRYEECDRSGKQGCPTRCVLQAEIQASPTTAPR